LRGELRFLERGLLQSGNIAAIQTYFGSNAFLKPFLPQFIPGNRADVKKRALVHALEPLPPSLSHSLDVVKYLTEKVNSEVSQAALFSAVKIDRLDIVLYLLSKSPAPGFGENKGFMLSFLKVAVNSNAVEVAKHLYLKIGADAIPERCKKEYFAKCVVHNKVELFRFLVSHGVHNLIEKTKFFERILGPSSGSGKPFFLDAEMADALVDEMGFALPYDEPYFRFRLGPSAWKWLHKRGIRFQLEPSGYRNALGRSEHIWRSWLSNGFEFPRALVQLIVDEGEFWQMRFLAFEYETYYPLRTKEISLAKWNFNQVITERNYAKAKLAILCGHTWRDCYLRSLLLEFNNFNRKYELDKTLRTLFVLNNRREIDPGWIHPELSKEGRQWLIEYLATPSTIPPSVDRWIDYYDDSDYDYDSDYEDY